MSARFYFIKANSLSPQQTALQPEMSQPDPNNRKLEDAFVNRVVIFSRAQVHFQDRYIAVQHVSTVTTKQTDYTNLPFETEIKFIVHKADGERGVVFESQKYRNMYLTMLDYGNFQLIDMHEGNPPVSDPSYVFTIEPVGPPSQQNKNLCVLRSRNRYLQFDEDAKTSFNLCGSQEYGDFCNWYGIVGSGGPIKDGYKLVSSADNSSRDTDYEHTYEYSIGTSTTNSSSATKEVNFQFEVSANFEAGPASMGVNFKVGFSMQWQTSTSSTWTESIKTTSKVVVKPHRYIGIYQLQGQYGDYDCGSSHIQIRDMDTQEILKTY